MFGGVESISTLWIRRGFLSPVGARVPLWAYLMHNIVIQYDGMERSAVSAYKNSLLKCTFPKRNLNTRSEIARSSAARSEISVVS